MRREMLLAVLLSTAKAILCPSGSQCAANCGNVLAATSPDDLVCDDWAFKSDPVGQLFAGCVGCQRSSTYHSGNESDVQTMLYNGRYVLSYCLWGDAPVRNPRVIDTPCITAKACEPFKDAVQFQNLSTKYDAFQYCDSWPSLDPVDLAGCTDCLQAESRFVMANFVIALQAGCLQKPVAGLFIGLDGDLFSSTALQISSPSPTAMVDPAWFDDGPITLGAKVGIAIGCIVGALVILGCGVVWKGKRRRRAFLRTLDAKHATAPDKQYDMGETMKQQQQQQQEQEQSFRGCNDTPVSQRALRGWNDTPVSQPPSRRGMNDSPLTAGSEPSYLKHLSPYSSQFSSPTIVHDARVMPWAPASSGPNDHIGLHVVTTSGTTDCAAGSLHWSPRSTASEHKGKSKAEKAYEMHEVDTSAGRRPQHEQSPENDGPPVLDTTGLNARQDVASLPPHT